MKYIRLLFLIFTFCIINTISIFAADTVIYLQSAVLQNNNIIVQGKLENPVSQQQIVIMAADVINNSYNKDGIFYFDQQYYAALDENGNFNVSFNINKVLSNESVYIVRLGGTNINTPVQMIITTGDEPQILLGDVNLDGFITADDAAITLQSVLFYIEGFTDRQIAAMKVTNSDTITSENAANILAKAINSMFLFPVER